MECRDAPAERLEPRSLALPQQRLAVILHHACAVLVRPSNTRLRCSIPLVRSLAVPAYRLAVILRHTPAEIVQPPNIELCKGISLVCGLTEPAHRLAVVLGYAPAVRVQPPNIVLGFQDSLVGGLSVPMQRSRVVFAVKGFVSFLQSVGCGDFRGWAGGVRRRGFGHAGRRRGGHCEGYNNSKQGDRAAVRPLPSPPLARLISRRGILCSRHHSSGPW